MNDLELVDRLLEGDERAFTDLVTRYHGTLVRVARYYVRTPASAEDVAQETWLAVLRSLSSFEQRSSFKTWLLRILVNRARSSGTREFRTVPVDPTSGSAVAASRFDEGGFWCEPPVPFTDSVDDRLVNEPLVHLVREAIAQLPEPQQAVITLRDVEGLSTSEVADLLELSDANVRVILHRARSRVRADVEARREGRSV
ncbi:MAG: RNA polymerase sigma factor [Acidimicrobiaceae bacterium]|nr:RNA polymerase sigma factor [Acidimicrobiaceae bacterium]